MGMKIIHVGLKIANLTYMIFTDDLRKGTSRIRADSKILDREVSPHGAEKVFNPKPSVTPF